MAESAVPISPVTATRPELVISHAAVNNEPIELDSSPLSADAARQARQEGATNVDTPQTAREVPGAGKEQLSKLILERKGDPAVLVDIPQTPGADELEKSGATQTENEAE